jgi:hypothetical protein
VQRLSAGEALNNSAARCNTDCPCAVDYQIASRNQQHFFVVSLSISTMSVSMALEDLV